MNLQHFQYVIEIEKTRSVTKAAENLCMSQPNLSRSIRELEHELGFSVFRRTAKGILLTPEGEELVARSRKIMAQVENVRQIGSPDHGQVSLRVSVPRAGYISAALARFVANLEDAHSVEIDYKETNAMRAIDNLLTTNYHLAIVRYQTTAEPGFFTLFQEKSLMHEVIASFSYQALLSRRHPLAERDTLTLDDLAPYFQLSYGDPYIPSLNFSQSKQVETVSRSHKHIYIYDRGSRLDLLCDVPGSYMWASPLPPHLLERYGLVSKPCEDVSLAYKDVLVYPVSYRLRTVDKRFVEELKKSRNQTFSNTRDML